MIKNFCEKCISILFNKCESIDSVGGYNLYMLKIQLLLCDALACDACVSTYFQIAMKFEICNNLLCHTKNISEQI